MLRVGALGQKECERESWWRDGGERMSETSWIKRRGMEGEKAMDVWFVRS